MYYMYLRSCKRVTSLFNEKRGPARRSLTSRRSAGCVQFTRRREMACGSNKVRRPHTEQFFIAFGIEMVDLPLAASATARTKEARKETARKAYVKRKAQRDSAAGAGRDKSVLRPESCGGASRRHLSPPLLSNFDSRNARAYTSVRSIGFCAIWVCISSSSRYECPRKPYDSSSVVNRTQ